MIIRILKTQSDAQPPSQSVKAFDDKDSSGAESVKTAENNKLKPWELWKLCDIGDIVGLSGELFKTQKGELSLRVKDLQILCKTLEALPEKYHGLEDKELKYRYRHLDLIMDLKSREVFKTRSKIIQEIRTFMNKKAFMEVETPVLQSIYGGAVAAPFETYFRRLNQKMYLKISPEIYLKKLIVGGFEKVFEIGKNFRNEGIDRTHNPEFTMMEYYQAYTDYKDQMKLFEELVCHVVKKIKGSLLFEYQGRELDFTSPWITISLHEFEDLLYNKAQSVGHTVVFEHQGREWGPDQFFEEINRDIQARRRKNNQLNFQSFWKEISSNKKNAQKEIKASSQTEKTKDHYKLTLDYAKSMDPKGKFEKFDNILEQKALSSQELIVQYKEELSLMTLELTVEKYFWNPVFITDFPLESSPLTKKHRDKKKPRIVERFEPYIAGMEIGNAYTELNDPVDQRQRLTKQERYFEKLKKGKTREREQTSKHLNPKDQEDDSNTELFHPIDENFLHALEVGMPPTGGVGLGIERLVMILTNQSHIRDSILFPVLRDKL